MAKKTKSFEEALSRLEEIVDAMEEGELSLDETVKLYKEGVEMASVCSEKLSGARQQISLLSVGLDGSMEEKPFEIPEGWMWCRLNDISWYLDAGKSPKCDKQPVNNNEWGVITTTAIQSGQFDETQNKILPYDFAVNTNMQIHKGDILITRAGPTNRTGVACVVKSIQYNLILSDKTVRINTTNNFLCKDYIVMALNSPQIRLLILELMSGMDKQQVNISQDKYKTLVLPLPPLAEQKRIVERVEELLAMCERLK